MLQEPFVAAANTPVLHDAFDALLGVGRWSPRPSPGSFPLRFPHSEEPDDAGWHIESSYELPGETGWWTNVHSSGKALLMLFLFTEVGEQDAPTRVRVASHWDVPAVLRPYGDRGTTPMSTSGPEVTAVSARRPVAAGRSEGESTVAVKHSLGRERVGHGYAEPAGQVVVTGAAAREGGRGVRAAQRAGWFRGRARGHQLFDEARDLGTGQLDVPVAPLPPLDHQPAGEHPVEVLRRGGCGDPGLPGLVRNGLRCGSVEAALREDPPVPRTRRLRIAAPLVKGTLVASAARFSTCSAPTLSPPACSWPSIRASRRRCVAGLNR